MRPLIFTAILLSAPVGGFGQPGEVPAPNVADDAPPDVSPDAAYLNTSFEAEEAIQRAQKHVTQGRWPAAATAFQRIGEVYGDYIIRVDKRRYFSIRRYVNKRIAGWPAVGLAAYRNAYERSAETALAHALDQFDDDPLVAIAEKYYPTQTGATALDAAAERAIERGDFQSARQWYTYLIATHPDRGERAPFWRTKRALCTAWRGDLTPLRKLSNDMPPENPGPQVTWAGRKRPLGAFIRDMLKQLETRNPQLATRNSQLATRNSKLETRNSKLETSSVSTFCGGANRRAFFESTAEPEARLWRFKKLAQREPLVDKEHVEFADARQNAYLRSVQSGRLLASMPVFGDGLLYSHDANSVLAVDPEDTSRPIWQFDLDPDAATEPQWISEDEPPEQFTSLLADGKLYVHLDRTQTRSDAEAPHEASTLVCLDAATGQLLWRNDLESLASQFEDIQLDGAPLLHHGRLFAVARRRKAFGFEACLLLCLDPTTGRREWQTHVGEAATGSYGYARPTRTHPAAAGDLIIVQTNLGTIAAVSATTGRVAWLTCYPSLDGGQADAAWPARFGRPIRSWQYQPTIVWRDALVCTPLDTEDMLILDQNDGRLKHRIPLDTLFNPETILGLHGDLLYTAGGQLVCYDLAARNIAWQRPLAEGRLFGRGALTTAGVFLPTDHGLLRYPLDGGPARIYRWGPEEAGNVLALPDQIVIASADALTGLIAKQAAFDRLTRRMTDRPKDPRAALALADLAFRTGENRRGLDATQQAGVRLGGFDRINDEPTRRQVFDQLIRFARYLAHEQPADHPRPVTQTDAAPPQPEAQNPKPETPNSQPATRNPQLATLHAAVKLLEMAGQCAPDNEGRVSCRLLLARMQLMRKNAEEAIRTYQQILSDRALRNTRIRIPANSYPPNLRSTVARDDLPPPAVALRVEDWINRLIAEHGRRVYEPIEQQARERLKTATAQTDLLACIELAVAFPNSQTAVEALLVHARLAGRRQQWKQAFRSYRRVLTEARCENRPEILREFALRLAENDRHGEADQWLERGSRDHPAFRFDRDGRKIGFDDLRPILIGDRVVRSAAHPTVALRLKKPYVRLFTDRVAVLSPGFDRLPETHWDAAITYAAGLLEAKGATTGRNIWPRPVPCEAEPNFLGVACGRYVFATTHRVFALTCTSGQPAWQFGEEPPDDPLADPESLQTWTDHAMAAQRLFCTSDHGDLVCIDLQDGSLRWRRETGSGSAGHLAANDRHAFYTRWKGRHNVVEIHDTDTGRPLHTVRPEKSWPFQALVPAGDDMLLAVRSSSILAIDAVTGAIRWRIDTPDHFVLSTLNTTVDGLFISDDSRRLTRYDLYTGRQRWRTPPIGTDTRDGLWAEIVGGRLLAASRNALVAFDSADGRRLWEADDPPGLRIQPPIVVANALITVGVVERSAEAADPPPPPREAPREGRRYHIRAFRLTDGRPIPLSGDGPLITEPVRNFSGLVARNHALLLLDADRLIGYVEENGE